jgi:hypothetical protein
LEPPLVPVGVGRSSACFRFGDVPPFAVGDGPAPGPAQIRLRKLQERHLIAAGATG